MDRAGQRYPRELSPDDPRSLGKYSLLRVLGEGGMGRVYLGRDGAGQNVALKIIKKELAGKTEYRERFQWEIKSCMKVGGEHTAEVRDWELVGTPSWLAIDYLKAPTLQELVGRQGRLPAETVLWLAVKISKILVVLEDLNLIHRDLKPSNIIVDESGPKLIDFGIAKDLGWWTTHSSHPKGTPGYWSPEQAEGGVDLTFATDVYSLGVTLAFAATGHHPGPNVNHLIGRTSLPDPDLVVLPAELRDLIVQCTRLTPERRIKPAGIIDRFGRPEQPPTAVSPASWLPVKARKVIVEYAERATIARPLGVQPPAQTPAQTPAQPSGRPVPELSRTGHDWTFQLGGKGYYASPVLAGGVVYAGAMDGRVHALNAVTGREIWSAATGGPVKFTPALCRGLLVVSSADRNVYAFDARTGAEIWRVPTDSTIATAPAAVGPRVIVGDLQGRVLALDAGTGEEAWRFQAGGLVYSRPGAADGLVFVGCWDRSLHALNAGTGERRWSFPTGGAIDSAPVVAEGLVYFGSGDRRLYAVEADTGVKRWEFPAEAPVDSGPALGGGMVYFGSNDNRLYAVDAGTGHGVWQFATGGPVRSSPCVRGGLVFFGSRDRSVYAVEAATGRETGRFRTGDWVDSSPALGGSVLYVGSWDGNIYALPVDVPRGPSGEEE